jgi:hypothetical protein
MLVLPNGDSGFTPHGTFTVASDPSAQVDLCLAAPAYDRSASGGAVPIAFRHALTRVMFDFNITGTPYPEEADDIFRVKSLTLEGVAGANTFAFDGGLTGGFSWNDLPRSDLLIDRSAEYALSVAGGTLVETELQFPAGLTPNYTRVNGLAAGTLYLIPQPLTGSAMVTVALEVSSDDGANWSDMPSEVVLRLPAETVWPVGATVVYSATFDISRLVAIEFGVTVLEWGSAETSTDFPLG